MTSTKRWVLASNNPGKLAEFARLFAPLGIELVAQFTLGISEADEPHPTFVENALAKARHAARAAGLPALADDSGLCVPALGGAPGVHSARYAGEPKSDARNNAKLVDAVRALELPGQRAAHYRCVLALVRTWDDPEPVLAQAAWAGEIVLEPKGEGGFGYDPYFWLPELGCTAAQLDAAHKNRISHRGLALERLLADLQDPSFRV